MNYAQARQRESDHRWDWTTMRSQLTRPSGYCAGWPGDRSAGGAPPIAFTPHEWNTYLDGEAPFRAQYHTDGHASKDDAERCFYQYALDHARRWRYDGPPNPDAKVLYLCEAPGCSTPSIGTIGGVGLDTLFTDRRACDAHLNVDLLRTLQPFSPGLQLIHS